MSMRGSGGSDCDGLEPDRFIPLGPILAHDLTNHLQIIAGQTDLLLDRLDEPTAVDRLMAIKRQATAANALVQTICEMGDPVSRDRLDPVDVDHILKWEIEHLRSTYPHVQVSTDVQEGMSVRADELLVSVFRNLLQNAVQHNDTDTPSISVTARTHGSRVTVVIEDDGPGIADGVERQLLGVERAIPGSGVGIVRRLVERYGGTISVDGSGGTRIVIEFPNERE